MGPNWRDQVEAQADAMTGAPPGGAGMPGAAGSAIPPFGGEADVPPEGGADPAAPTPVSDIGTSLPGSA